MPATHGETPLGPPATWAGETAASAAAVSDQHSRAHTQLVDAQRRVADAVADANDAAHNAHTTISAIDAVWQSDKASLGPLTDSADARAGLLRASQQRVGEATDTVESVVSQYHQSGQTVRAATQALPHIDPSQAAVPY